MKKLLLIGGIVVFFLGILAAVLFKVFAGPDVLVENTPVTFPEAPASSVTSASQSPTEVAKACMKWYVEAYEVGNGVLWSEEFEKGVSLCFTTSFVESWDVIRDETELDPVLFATIHQPSWLTTQSASAITQDISSSNVLVTLGSGSETLKLNLDMQKTISGWRIANTVKSN